MTYPDGVTVPELLASVSAAGYQRGELPAEAAGPAPDQAARGWARRFWVCLALSLPVLLLAMVPSAQFDDWQWCSLALAAPVVVWGGWPFHPATWTNLRHRAATMDTLISIGVLAAFGWSV